MPDSGSSESGDHLSAKNCRSTRSVFDHLGRSPTDALRIAVAPDVCRHHRAVALVYKMLAYALTDKTHGGSPALEAMLVQHRAVTTHISIFGERPVDVEVISAPEKLQKVVPQTRSLAASVERGSPPTSRSSARPAHFLPLSLSHADGTTGRPVRALS